MMKLLKRFEKPKQVGNMYQLFDDTVRVDKEPKGLWKIYKLIDGIFIKVEQTEDLPTALKLARSV